MNKRIIGLISFSDEEMIYTSKRILKGFFPPLPSTLSVVLDELVISPGSPEL